MCCGDECENQPLSVAEYGLSYALRPKNSRLDKSKLLNAVFKSFPDWKDATVRYIKKAQI